MSPNTYQVPTRIAPTRDSIFVGNYARSRHWFESGFSGFRGLTITSLVSVGRLLLDGAFIYRPFADALSIGEREGVKSIQFTNNPQVQSEDVLFNPLNP